MDPSQLPPGVSVDQFNQQLATLGPPGNPTVMDHGSNITQEDNLRHLQILKDLERIRNAKPADQELTPSQQAARYLHNPWNTMLTHSSGPPSSENWYGAKDLLGQSGLALAGIRGPNMLGSVGGEIASPDMGHFFTSQVASKLPQATDVPNIMGPESIELADKAYGAAGGNNSNISPISKIPDMLKLIQKHDPYGFARLNQSISKSLEGETRQSYQSNMDRLMGNPVGPPSSHLIGDNIGSALGAEGAQGAIKDAGQPLNVSVSNLLDHVTKAANDRLPIISRTDKRPMTQEDWNNYKKLNPSMFPEDPPNGQ